MSRRRSSTRSAFPEGALAGRSRFGGVRLDELIGRRFRVGDVECYGVEICEPCLVLERNTRPGIIRDLVHRAGINADILTDGTISLGDEITVIESRDGRLPKSEPPHKNSPP